MDKSQQYMTNGWSIFIDIKNRKLIFDSDFDKDFDFELNDLIQAGLVKERK